MERYKLVYQQYRTQNETCWQLPDGTHPRIHARGAGDSLCTAGVIHSYASPELAAFMNIVHAAIREPRCIVIDAGPMVADDGTKGGHKWAQMVREVPMPVPTLQQRVVFAILSVRAIPGRAPIPIWEQWADDYLRGYNASVAGARAAEEAATATYARASAAYTEYAEYAVAHTAACASAIVAHATDAEYAAHMTAYAAHATDAIDAEYAVAHTAAQVAAIVAPRGIINFAEMAKRAMAIRQAVLADRAARKRKT